MRAVIDRVRRVRSRPSPELDRVVSSCPPRVDGKPFDQGYQLAIWLREKLARPVDSIEPEDVLRSWGVTISDLQIATDAVDAVCCWGPRHGPTIFLNPNGKHLSSRHGRRSTLAHEICHLLLDRQKALPLAEVLGGRMLNSIESRARAFAAEFLLPRKQAVSALRRSQNPAALVRSLSRLFVVSPEVVAWQLHNSGEQLNPEQAAHLQTLVKTPGRF
jgi:Zn-dependent peptidase ImmA (M78 family)